jgi:hypothetical protein
MALSRDFTVDTDFPPIEVQASGILIRAFEKGAETSCLAIGEFSWRVHEQ